MGFETMSHVETAKGNEFIALASDTNFDFPVGGYYNGYYAMMVVRHMHEFGTTEEQLARIAVKNHNNACHNPYAQEHLALTVDDVMHSDYIAWPLKRHDICVMSDGAAVCILASEKAAEKFCDQPGQDHRHRRRQRLHAVRRPASRQGAVAAAREAQRTTGN